MKKFILICCILIICIYSVAAYAERAERAEFPKTADYLSEENLAAPIFERAVIPDEYLFPNDWVKQQDWEAIREEFGGTRITMAIEGTDIGAPHMFVDHFEELSGIEVDLIGIPPEYLFEKLFIAFSARVATYDVINCYSVELPAFSRFFENLEPYIEKWNYDWEDWFPVWQELSKHEGKILGLPFDSDMQFFHSRAKFLRELGYDRNPATWEEFIEYADKLLEILPPGVYPFGLMADRTWMMLQTFWNFAAPFGANMLKPGTWEPDWNSEEAVQALDFFKMVLDKYCAPGSTVWGYEEHLEAWNMGQFAMCLQYPNQEAYNPAMSAIAFEERWHSPVPKSSGPKGRLAPSGTYSTSLFAIPENSRNKDAAFLWIAFLNSAEVSFIYTIAGTGLDYGRISTYEHPLSEKLYMNHFATLESMDYAYFFPRLPELPELVAVAVPLIHDAITGVLDSQYALDRVNEGWRAILERGGYYEPDAPEPLTLWMQDVLAQ